MGVVSYHQTVIETLNWVETKRDDPTPAQLGYEKMNMYISFGMLLVSCYMSRYEKPKPYVIISKLLPIHLIEIKSAVESSLCIEVNNICRQ